MAVTLHTNFGDIKVEVFCDLVPRASENFLALCASGYYKGSKFHRNIKGFMLQGGDPSGTGKGGESIWGVPFKDEFHPDLKHSERGVMSMANKGLDSNGSQFFFLYGPQPHLNNKFSIFGRILDGWETLDAIEKVPVGGKNSRPLQDVVIENVTIHANPLA